MRIVPATPELAEQYFGRRQSRTMKALAVVKDGEPICIAGVYEDRGRAVAFANIKEEMRKYPVMGMKFAREVLKTFEGTVYAVCDSRIEPAQRFLEHLGFTHVMGEVYAWRKC